MRSRIFNVEHDDLTFILNLNNKFSKEVGMSDIDNMTYFLDTADYFKRIEFDGKNVGFLIAISPNKDYQSENYIWFNKKYKSFIYIDRIVIKGVYQNKGLGKIFYEDLIAFSKSNASKRIACEVNIKPLNDRSIIFHDRLGFKEVGQQDTNQGEKRVSLMVLDIQGDLHA